MKTNSQLQRGKMIFLAILAIVLFAAAGAFTPAHAQAAEPPQAPLFPGFIWDKLGKSIQELNLNGATTSVSGIRYQAQERFQNFEKAPAEFFAFYSSTALAKSGWTEIQATGGASSAETLYFHAQGFFALVKFEQCGDQTCVTIWESVQTDLTATPQPNTNAPLRMAGTISKKAPADGADDLKNPVTLSWTAYSGTGLNRYRYCIDTTNDDDCDIDPFGWTNAWNNTSVEVTDMELGKTYYWQAEAVLNDNTKISADGGEYWTLSTISFKKLTPTNNAARQPLKATLTWQVNPYSSAAGYKYCISKSTVTCATWVKTLGTSVQVNVSPHVTYQWQVKALNSDSSTIEADNGTWWKFTTTASGLRFDFNGDLKDDIALFRPSDSKWYIYGKTAVKYGLSTDIPVPGDYNKDGKAEIATYRSSNSTWYIQGRAAIRYGQTGDIPVPADYNGDGQIDIALFRPSTGAWLVKGISVVVYGETGDIPVPADYNGDGKAERAVFRPSENQWYIAGQTNPVLLGAAGDILVPADYTGDGKTDVAVFRPSEGAWIINGVAASVQYGQDGDIPVPSDFNGDGKADYAVFRPSLGKWFFRGSAAKLWGTSGDTPIGRYYYIP